MKKGITYKQFHGEEKAREIKEKLRKANIGKKQSKETKAKRVETRRNNGKPWFSKEAKKNIGMAGTGRKSPNTIGDKNPAKRFEVRRKISEAKIRHWQDPEYIKKQMKAFNVKQNKIEKLLENILCDLFLNEYKFVGDGKFILAGKCPDFVNVNGQKKIIELYGDYWHRNDNPHSRIELFAQYGYQTLIVWEHELRNLELVKQKILEFNHE